MHTNSRHHRSFVGLLFSILYLLMLPELSESQALLKGGGIELGGGYNQLFWQGWASMAMGAAPLDRTHFFVAPNIRLTYNADLSAPLTVMPFIGYNQFGGSYDQSGEQSKYTFDVIEFGSFLLVRFSDLSLGVGGKVNWHLTARYHYAYAQYSFDEDHADWFTGYSPDAGARISYAITPFSVSIESWFGLTNLIDTRGVTIHQNHHRFLVGYML